MSRQHVEQVSVTFHDIAACFSEEEWKLLHDWQKELYQNVMKEIHQALISLGPLITTTVFSLKAKEKQELYPVGNLDCEGRHSVTHSPSDPHSNADASFGINREKKQYLMDPQDTDRRKNKDCFSTEPEASLPIVSLIVKEEKDTDYMDHQDSERRDRISNPAGFNFLNTESEECFVDNLGAGGGENGINFISDGPFVTSAYTSSPNNEEETHFKEGMKHEERTTCDGLFNRCNEDVDSIQCAGKIQPSTASSGIAKSNVPQSSKKLTNSRSQQWPQCSQEHELKKTTPCESGFSDPAHGNLHQAPTKTETTYAYNESDSTQRNAMLSTYLRKTQQSQRPYTCTEYEKNNSQKEEFIRLKKTHTGVRLQERPFACPDCGKSFSLKANLKQHRRTHTGERPYTCTDCQKSFTHKGVLNRHQRTHTGEKPYTCLYCGKTFSRKYMLNEHKQIHTGECITLERKVQKSRPT